MKEQFESEISIPTKNMNNSLIKDFPESLQSSPVHMSFCLAQFYDVNIPFSYIRFQPLLNKLDMEGLN